MKKYIFEILLVIIIGIGISLLFSTYIYPTFGLPSNGPIPARTIILVLVVSIFLKKSGLSWTSYGLNWPFKWYHLIATTVIILLLKLFVVQEFSDWTKSILNLGPSDHSFFSHIEGNTIMYIVWLIIAWAAGGFAEEMLFRGYLLQGLAKHLGDSKLSWVAAITFQAVLFGLFHSYANLGAVMSTLITGLFYGTCIMVLQRSIWPLIIVHGLWDTLGITQLFLEGLS